MNINEVAKYLLLGNKILEIEHMICPCIDTVECITDSFREPKYVRLTLLVGINDWTRIKHGKVRICLVKD